MDREKRLVMTGDFPNGLCTFNVYQIGQNNVHVELIPKDRRVTPVDEADLELSELGGWLFDREQY